ncbi:MAG: tape measure protein [Eubacteriales bacterium]|nr:tape measure protein [Eubacteriales bacterium]
MGSKTINTILNLQDRMSPKLIKVSDKVKKLDKDTQRATQKMANMANKWTSSVDKMVSKAGRLAKVGASVAIAASGAGAVALVKQSDAYSGMQARLKLINDGQQTVAQFNEKIFKSANNARTSYEDMADVVGKLGITASGAFEGNDEILKFTELLSKNFKIAGASTQEQSSAMYQLTQAMAAGKLQGDEFRSISENAPLLAQAISKEMGVSVGELKKMSSEGKITSDIIKSALFNSADAINKQYKEIPMTFAEAATKMKSQLTNKLQPSFKKLSNWLNSTKGEKAINKTADAIARLAAKMPAVFKALGKIYNFAKKVYDTIIKYQDFIVFFGTFAVSIIAVTKAATLLKTAFAALQIVTMLLNGTLMLSPLGWIAIGIGLVIAAGVLLYKNWDTVKEKCAGFATGIKKLWKGLIDFLKHPIKGTVKLFKESNEGGGKKPKGAGKNALGTPYWRGGFTQINERGGEIIDLPSGSRVIPADKSQQMINNSKSNVFNININGVGKSTDEIINEFVPKLKLALANM